MSNLVPILGVNRHRLLIDGEGVTTLVAFHGCPLHCKYCLNPQSLSDDFDFPLYSCEQLYERETSLGTFFLKAKIQQKAKQELPGYYDIQMTEYR